jgi:putative ABC transport system permease protein
MSPFRLAFLSLTRRKVSTLLALVAISLAVAFSGVLLRTYLSSSSRFSSLALGPEAVIGAKSGGIDILLGALNLEGSYPGYIPYKLYASLASGQTVQFEDGVVAEPSYIKSVVPFLYFGKLKNYRAIATDESFLRRPYAEDSLSLKEGRWVANEANEVVLGFNVAQKEKIQLNDNLLIESWTSDLEKSTGGISLKVVGILEASKKSWDNGLYSSLKVGWSVLKNKDLSEQSIWKEQVLNYFLIYVDPKGFLPLENLINRRTVAQVISTQTEFKKLEDLTGTGQNLGLLVSILIVCLGALGVTAMMVTRFDAMSTQLAVLRAMGYEKSEIRRWLLWEGALLGIGACGAGGLLDLLTFPIVRNLLGSALPPSEFVSIPIWLSSPVWIAALMGTMAAIFIPLYRLYHQDVHSALRA